jgi:hypothetical protein
VLEPGVGFFDLYEHLQREKAPLWMSVPGNAWGSAWLGSDAGRAIDVAHDAANRWVRLRSLNPEGRVAGLTTWSDFVQVRGLLQEKGKRLRVESRSGDLFYWEMG